MLYFELGLGAEDYLTERESKLPIRIRKLWWNIKAKLGIVVKKKVEDKVVYVLPKIDKKFLKRVDKILKISGDKQICISDELYYREEFLNLIKKNDVSILNGNWIKKYILLNYLEYIRKCGIENFSEKEIAFLVDSDYELVVEYIKNLAPKFKLITIVTNNIRKFNKIEEKYLNQDGINLNVVNNYRKSLIKTDIIVNLDFEEKELKKYTIYNRTIFINLYNNYEIDSKKFEGINIINCQISMPNKYLEYVELFYNFNYLSVYESFIKKKTSIKNILNEIENDKLEIIWIENEKGMLSKREFLEEKKKVLDK
ncbi:MAG: hypothetical protein J6J60_03590 [Clostridia bacterium]|nr:hypothetical protein [Clostridia bacterium]